MDSSDFGDGQVAGFCVHGVVPSGCIKCGEFLEYMRNSGFARTMALICGRYKFEKLILKIFLPQTGFPLTAHRDCISPVDEWVLNGV